MLRTRTGSPICVDCPLAVSGCGRWGQIRRDVHEEAKRAKEKEGDRAEDSESKRPRTHERLGKGETPTRARPSLGSDGSHTAHAVNDWINFPMGADAQRHGSCVPPVMECIVQREEDEGAENGFGGAAGGDTEYEWVQ